MSEILRELGWTKAKLARNIGLTRETVSRYGDDPPRVVMAYLELALILKRNGDVVR